MSALGERFAPTADRLLAAAFIAITQLEIWLFEADSGYSLGFRIAVALLTAVASGALAIRRSQPVVAIALNGAAVIATIAVGFPSDFYQWTNLIATYSISAHGKTLHAWAALPFAIGGVLFYFIRFPAEGGFFIAGFAAAMWLVGWLAGRIYGSKIEEVRLRAERDLSVQVARAQEEMLAVEAERSRIARELHDIIGHSVNVMVVHAGAGRGVVGKDPDATRKAFDTIESTGRAALGELDRVLAILRRDEEAPELGPPPGLTDIHALADTFIASGLDVTTTIEGDPSLVPPSVALSAYRIAQEALTNTFKHAGAGNARVGVDIAAERLTIRIADDGSGLRDDQSTTGRGIRGMRERAALHHGDLGLRPADPGLEVTATLHWGSAS